MANFTRIRLPGFWIAGSVVDPEEFEALDAIRELLINAGAGSTHAPTEPVILGGAGLRATGLLDVDGPLEQDAASDWELSGAIDLLPGGVLTLRSGSASTMQGGHTLTVQAGADANIAGNITWQANNWPRLTSRTITRSGWRLVGAYYTGSSGVGPDGPAAWIALDDTGTRPALQTATSTSSSKRFIIELLDLPPGATLNSVTVSARGTAGDANVSLPMFALFRWKEDTFDNMSSVTEASNDPSAWTTRADTVVNCTSHSTIDSSYNYCVLVESPYGTTPASMKLFAFTCSLSVSSIQL